MVNKERETGTIKKIEKRLRVGLVSMVLGVGLSGCDAPADEKIGPGASMDIPQNSQSLELPKLDSQDVDVVISRGYAPTQFVPDVTATPEDHNANNNIVFKNPPNEEELREIEAVRPKPWTIFDPETNSAVLVNDLPARVRQIGGWKVVDGRVEKIPTQFGITIGSVFSAPEEPWGVPGDELWVPYRKENNGFRFVIEGSADGVLCVFYNRQYSNTDLSKFTEQEIVDFLNKDKLDFLGNSLETLAATQTFPQALEEYKEIREYYQ